MRLELLEKSEIEDKSRNCIFEGEDRENCKKDVKEKNTSR